MIKSSDLLINLDLKSKEECDNLNVIENWKSSDSIVVGKNVPGEHSNDVTVPKPILTSTSVPSSSSSAGAGSTQKVTLNTSSLFPSEKVSHPNSHPHPTSHLPSHLPSHPTSHYHHDDIHSFPRPLHHSTPFPDLLSPVPFQKYSSPHTFPSPSTARYPPSYSSSSSSSSTPFFSPNKHHISDSDSIHNLHGNQNLYCIKNSREEHDNRLNYTGQFNDTADTGIFEKFMKSKNSVMSMKKMKKISSSNNSDVNFNHIKFNGNYHELNSRENGNKLRLKGNIRADDEYGKRSNDVRDVRTYSGNRRDNYGINFSFTGIKNNRYNENSNRHDNINENYNGRKYSYNTDYLNKNEIDNSSVDNDDDDGGKHSYESRSDQSSDNDNDDAEVDDNYGHKYDKNRYSQNGNIDNYNYSNNNNDNNNNYNNYNNRNNNNKIHRNQYQTLVDGRSTGDSRKYSKDDYNDGNNNNKNKNDNSNKNYVDNGNDNINNNNNKNYRSDENQRNDHANTIDRYNNDFDNINYENKIPYSAVKSSRNKNDKQNYRNSPKYVKIAVRKVDFSPSRNNMVLPSKSPKWQDNISPIPHSKNVNRKILNTKNKFTDNIDNDDDYDKCRSNRDEGNFNNCHDNNDGQLIRRKQSSKIDYYVSDNDDEGQQNNNNENNKNDYNNNDNNSNNNYNDCRDSDNNDNNNHENINNNLPLPLPTANITPVIYPYILSNPHSTSHSSSSSHPPSSSSSHSSSHPPSHLIQNPHTVPSILSSSTLYRVVVDSYGLSRLTPVTEIPKLSKLTISQNVVLNNNDTLKEKKIIEKIISVSENVQKDSSSQTDSEIYGNGFREDVIVNDKIKEKNDMSDDHLKIVAYLEEKGTFPLSEKVKIKNENNKDGTLDKTVNNIIEEKENENENEEKSVNLETIKKDEMTYEHEHYITPPYSPSSLFVIPSYPVTNHNNKQEGQRQGQEQKTVLLSDIRHLISLSPFISPIAANGHDHDNINNEYNGHDHDKDEIGKSSSLQDQYNDGINNNDIKKGKYKYDNDNGKINDVKNNNSNNSNDAAGNISDTQHFNNSPPQKVNILNENTLPENQYSPTSFSTKNFIQKELYLKKNITKSSTTYSKNLYGPYSINNLLSNKPVMSMSSSFWKKRLSFMRQGFYHGDSFN